MANFIDSSKLILNIQESNMIKEKLCVIWDNCEFQHLYNRNENKIRLDKTKLKYFLNKF